GKKGIIWIFLIKLFKEAKSILNYDKIIKDVVVRTNFYFNQAG
ncbi:unnamed protein product, partial [marine sediment metagenome]